MSLTPETLARQQIDARRGGLGRAHQLFGEQLPALLDERNTTLAA